MGVLDLLRRRSRTEATDSVESLSQDSPEQRSDSVQMRGDFMLLPPLRPTFGAPVRLQHGLDDFLVTHREVAVTNEPLAHEIDPQRLGLVTARARRSPRPRRALDPLIHRHDPAELDIEEYAEQLPAPVPPRRLPARPRPPETSSSPEQRRESIEGELPTISQVHRSVSAPSIRISAPEIGSQAQDLGALREAARMESATDAPIVRRRGGALETTVSDPVPTPAVPTPAMATDEAADIDLDALTAPSAAEMPPLTGGTRVRGATPPEAPAATRPLVGTERPAVTDETSSSATSESAPLPSLEHRVTTAAPQEPMSVAPAAPVSAGTIPAPESAAADSTPSVSPAGTIQSSAASAARETRALLSERAPLSSARGTSSTGAPAGTPGAAGRTGVQRKARANPVSPAPARVLPPSTPGTQSNPERGATPAPPSRAEATSLGAAESIAPPVAQAAQNPPNAEEGPRVSPSGAEAPEGPRQVEISPEVRRAVAAATGSAPETVLVHQSDEVHAEADALNAEAFTRDGEIHLARDADLDTPRGQALLAHELTHVVQQRGGSERMPDESTQAGQRHEEMAQQVERAIARVPEQAPQAPLEHAGGGEAEGAAPANVPQGVQRRGREIGAFGSINRDSDEDDNDDDALIGAPPQPEPAIAHASALQPSVLEQVELVHAGQAPPVREESDPGPGLGARAKSTFERMMLSPAAPKAKARRSASTGSSLAPITRTEVDSSGASAGGSEPGTTGEQPRPEPGAKEQALDYFSRMMLSPAKPKPDDEPDERRANLERQADSLYPYLRSRLRAELVRDRERRGRLARDWR